MLDGGRRQGFGRRAGPEAVRAHAARPPSGRQPDRRGDRGVGRTASAATSRAPLLRSSVGYGPSASRRRLRFTPTVAGASVSSRGTTPAAASIASIATAAALTAAKNERWFSRAVTAVWTRSADQTGSSIHFRFCGCQGVAARLERLVADPGGDVGRGLASTGRTAVADRETRARTIERADAPHGGPGDRREVGCGHARHVGDRGPSPPPRRGEGVGRRPLRFMCRWPAGRDSPGARALNSMFVGDDIAIQGVSHETP